MNRFGNQPQKTSQSSWNLVTDKNLDLYEPFALLINHRCIILLQFKSWIFSQNLNGSPQSLTLLAVTVWFEQDTPASSLVIFSTTFSTVRPQISLFGGKAVKFQTISYCTDPKIRSEAYIYIYIYYNTFIHTSILYI